MRGVRLDKPFDELPEDIADFDQEKLALYKQYGADCAVMLEGPKPNVDYGKIAAALPNINERIEFINQGIFKTAPVVFATLVQMKKNSHGGTDHLIITQTEKADLINRIRTIFGSNLDQPDQNYIVSAASVLEFYLAKKGYKTSDEPWE